MVVMHRAAPGKKWPDGNNARRCCSNGGLCRCLLPYNGWLYVPGDCWCRINPETFAEEMLVPGRLPPKYSLNLFAVSAHYGLVAWSLSGWDGSFGATSTKSRYSIRPLPSCLAPRQQRTIHEATVDNGCNDRGAGMGSTVSRRSRGRPISAGRADLRGGDRAGSVGRPAAGGAQRPGRLPWILC